MSDTGLYYDEEEDKIVFFHDKSDLDSHTNVKIAIDREYVLLKLLDMASDYGNDFTIFMDDEETELTFLTPPTRDCVFEEDSE